MLIYNGQIIAGGGTIVLPMTRAEYEANKAILDSADVWVDLTDEPDQVATAEQIAYWVGQTQKSVGYIGDIATKALAKVEPTDTALYLHEVGEYFINKDGDACKVDLQIPVDGTITLGTNCHVLSKGVANDINSNLTQKMGLVDYSNVIDTITTHSASYTATQSGVIMGSMANDNGGFVAQILVNGVQIAEGGATTGTTIVYMPVNVPIDTGDIVTTRTGHGQYNLKIFAFK